MSVERQHEENDRHGGEDAETPPRTIALLHEYDEELVSRFEVFFEDYVKEKVVELSLHYPRLRSLEVSVQKLSQFDIELADTLLVKPEYVIRHAEEALAHLLLLPPSIRRPHVRFFDLTEHRLQIEHLDATYLNKLVAIEALVTKRGELRHRLLKGVYECVLCGATHEVVVRPDTIAPKTFCDTCKRRGLKLAKEKSEFINIQRAEIQELLENVKPGAPAAHIHIQLEDDLVNTIVPGERIEVTGILRLRQVGAEGDTYVPFVDVVAIKKLKRDFEEIELTPEEEEQILALSRDPDIFRKLSQSVAPSIYGHEEVKQGIVLQLLGGTPNKVLRDGGEIRSDMHILLIGDPGAAKTRLLQFVHALAPKSIYVSGKSVTGAGLTAAAERDEIAGEKGWVLKAGALVLASGGIGCIDEFDKIGKEDISSLHEVMESQTVSVAKAGIVTQFRAKTAILAAANPKFGRFDPSMPFFQQFMIPETLLSRFDLIFIMRDVLDEEKDRKLADHILTSHKEAGEYVQKGKRVQTAEGTEVTDIIPPTLMKKYIAYARKRIFPVLSDEALTRIREYYTSLRRMGKTTGTVTATARQIEALVRMSEASAKARLSSVVSLEDAERAINLLDFVAKSIYTDRETGKLDVDIITTGQPRSKVEKYKVILGIINRLETQIDEVTREDIVQEAASHDIDAETVERLLEELRTRGEIYSPKPGVYKILRT